MTSPFQQRAQALGVKQPEANPVMSTKKINPFKERAKQLEPKEGWGKSALRTLYQIPSGVAQAYTYPLDLINLLAAGSAYDPEAIEEFRIASERAGIPFDEERYLQGVQQAAELFPTQGNIERMIEEKTGAPLTAKTKLQKGIKLASLASKIAPSPGTFRGLNIGLPRPVLGAGVAGASALGQELGVPEPVADIASFALLKSLPPGSAQMDIGKAVKPSGMVKRGYESLKKPREVSRGKFEQITKKVESDFKDISNKIIAESPVGETRKALLENPLYKQESRELLDEAQKIADVMNKPVDSRAIKSGIKAKAAKQKKGYVESEYDKSYNKFVNEAIDSIPDGEILPGSLVEQYRKNNGQLGEYFEPGASKSFNRAKRDALLDHNRAIAEVMEKAYPNSELVPVFKEGNERWKKIMDMEVMDDFINDLFAGKINYKKGQKFFDDPNTERIFKRALGDKYATFETLMKDMLATETPYKMLEVAKSNGWKDLFSTGSSYILHPTLAKGKLALSAGKKAFRFALNSLLDKPKLTVTWKRAIDNLKQGNFKEADKAFKTLKGEIQLPSEKAPVAAKVGETIEVTPQSIRRPTEQNKAIGGQSAKQVEFKQPAPTETPAKLSVEAKKPPKKSPKKAVDPKPVIEKKIETASKNDISKKGLKDQKNFIMEATDKALKKPPKGEKIVIKVPGDGEFTINNNPEAIKKFQSLVEKKWPDKAIRKKPLHR